MIINDFALQALSTACNQYLSLDPNVGARLEKLNGKVIQITLKGLNLNFYLNIQNSEFVFTSSAAKVDTHMTGTPLAMMSMGMRKLADNPGGLFGENVEITGDTETGHQVKQILDGLDIDWEEQCAKLCGDIVAHQIGNVVRGFQDWGRNAGQSVQRNVSEFIQEEVKLSPPREALDDFFEDVDRFRSDVDRLKARIEQLEQKT
jgi:ubiquinone biosynthesis accessory factor UbiJ